MQKEYHQKVEVAPLDAECLRPEYLVLSQPVVPKQYYSMIGAVALFWSNFESLVNNYLAGFMLADNLIELKQAEMMVHWCADVLDGGALGTAESSMAKVAASEALMRVADRCVQVMGGQGPSP